MRKSLFTLTIAATRKLPLLAVLLTASSANAETAMEMKSHCTSVAVSQLAPDGQVRIESSFPAGVCWGAFGALQNISRFQDGDHRVLYFCPPEESTRLQFIRVFVKYVDEHPERSHEEWTTIGLNALQAAFPCN
ncbi:Rap1a/Tai family immunity protein [Sinorhizobium fredii]|uniref:Rap1a/Tai family immunity protein n=1 Tax=Rhizobium fredii TaxID=380 RepID=UPI0030A1BCFA